MTDSTEYWINPKTPSFAADTVVFDVDGVLIDEKPSFREAVIATTHYFTSSLGAPRVTYEEVAAFKRAGGLNNDWDLSYTLIALLNATYSNDAADTPKASLTALAEESGGRGVSWVKALVPAQAHPDYAKVKQVFNEYYWGTDLIETHLGLRPQFLSNQRGFVLDEPVLIPTGFFDRLRKQGVRNFGVITGRNLAEWKMGLEMLGTSNIFGCVLTDEDIRKPDPMALLRMVETFQPTGMVFIGDTRDDLELVRNFAGLKQPELPPVLSVIVAPQTTWDYWQDLGADALVTATPMLLHILRARIDSPC